MSNRRRALYLSHGGGPLPLLGDRAHSEMVTCLRGIADSIEKPSAVIVISAHWEADRASVLAGAAPGLLYDYSGFPVESYSIEYPCPGNPVLAKSILRQLQSAGFHSSLDSSRGFDHGHFVPMKIMYPEADIPSVQISLIKGLDPLEHIKLGRALQDLADPSILLIGSGFSFHNMRAFFSPDTAESQKANATFENWLLETCSSKELIEKDRAQQLINWEHAPAARYCHPREEHLLPLHVCYGYVESPCTRSFELEILGKKASMYLWEIEE